MTEVGPGADCPALDGTGASCPHRAGTFGLLCGPAWWEPLMAMTVWHQEHLEGRGTGAALHGFPPCRRGRTGPGAWHPRRATESTPTVAPCGTLWPPCPPLLCRLMLGFMGVTAFLSMWISNTATTAMMVPIVEAMLQQMQATTPATEAGLGALELSDKNKAGELPGEPRGRATTSPPPLCSPKLCAWSLLKTGVQINAQKALFL